MLSAANRRRAFSWSTTSDEQMRMCNTMHSPLVVLEHIKNNRSKHQYEKRSRGTKDPNSVLPKSYCWSTFTFSTFPEWCELAVDILGLTGSSTGSYSTLPLCKICASWLTRWSGTRLSPRCGATSISREAISARSKFSSASCASNGNASAVELAAHDEDDQCKLKVATTR